MAAYWRLADVDGLNTSSFTAADVDDVFYFAVTDGTDTGIFKFESNDADLVIDADEITLIATLTAQTSVDAGSLADFA